MKLHRTPSGVVVDVSTCAVDGCDEPTAWIAGVVWVPWGIGPVEVPLCEGHKHVPYAKSFVSFSGL